MASKKYYDCSFGGYIGPMRWLVSHPRYRDCVARAPDDIAAIKAAGDYWGEDWLRMNFYTNCKVTKM